MRLPAILIATLLASPSAMAQLYKCTGPDGKVNFTDSPCKGTEQAQTLQRVPPQGLDKMRIEIEQHRVDQQKWEADYQASLAAEEAKQRNLYLLRRMHEGLRIGMTEADLEAIPHWRWSEDSNITRNARVVREQRVFRASYDNEFDRMYLYFTNGVLTSIQD